MVLTKAEKQKLYRERKKLKDQERSQNLSPKIESSESTNSNLPIKKSSIAWLYFTETDHPNKVRCTKCNSTCSFTKKSTGNLMRHMKLKHPDLCAAYTSYAEGISQLQSQNTSQDETCIAVNEITIEDDENSENSITEEKQCDNTVETSTPSTVTEQQNVQTVAYYLLEEADANQAKEIDKQILNLIAKEFYSFDLVENQEFIAFVNMLNPSYALPNYNSLSSELLQETYEYKTQQLKSILKEIRYIALTIDRWSSMFEENFIAVTAHYLNKDLALQTNFLDCISYLKGSSINIPVFLQELVGKWGISNKIVAVVTENDPIIIEAINECQWQHISCFARTLNAIIMKCLEKINNVTTKVRNTVDYIKRIPDAMAQLQAYQNEMCMTNVKLKRDTPSRWNSTFDMITRFLKNKEILNSQLIKDLPNELSFNDWLILDNTVKLLVVFNTITVEICSEKNVSLSKVPHMIRFMIKHVNNIVENMPLPNEIKEMGKELKEKLTQQSEIIEANDVICQSVLLDPRLKKRGFPDNVFSKAYSSLLQSVISLKNERMLKTWIAQSGKQENTQQEYFIDIWSEFRDTQKQPEYDFTPDATAEIDAFLSETYVNMKDNPLTYWGNETNQNKFPILFELVKSRLCVPASSVPCKNIFSEAGNALIERRNFLSSKHLRQILFLHHNL